MDDLDHRIINELQEQFPLEANPYEVLANNIGISEDELWRRIRALVESGVIRRIGFSIDSRMMGYFSTLIAIRVAQDRINEASELIAMYPQITHSYLRENEFNIWFTMIVENKEKTKVILDEICLKLGLSETDIMDLPVQKLFKLDARFK